MEVPLDDLKEYLDYDQRTGVFKWRKRPFKSRVTVGHVAGSITTEGYLQVQFHGKVYLLHRLAYLFKFGRFPFGSIDHMNGVRTDNRIENLRDVTQRENMWNQPVHREGVKEPCVTFRNRNKKKPWEVSVRHKGKLFSVGCFPTKEQGIIERDRFLETIEKVEKSI